MGSKNRGVWAASPVAPVGELFNALKNLGSGIPNPCLSVSIRGWLLHDSGQCMKQLTNCRKQTLLNAAWTSRRKRSAEFIPLQAASGPAGLPLPLAGPLGA